jgi:hypothetical protein
MVEGEELKRILYGDVLDALGTEAFGVGLTRSDEADTKLQELAELNFRELRSGALSAEDEARRSDLRNLLPTTAELGSYSSK